MSYACHSPCNQGRLQCPVPQACRVVDEGGWEPMSRGEAARFWAVIVCCCCALCAAVAGFA